MTDSQDKARSQSVREPSNEFRRVSMLLEASPPDMGYRHPLIQIVIVSMVCFCCPGMFNALSGLGGGGQIDATTADNANVALYSTFATTAFLSGTIVNKLGPRLSLSIGSLGYTLFIGSYLSYNINQNSGFVIAAGAILGVCAGLLWTAQGSLMLAYSTEATKGRYIAMFWIIFSLGAVLGEAVALGRFHDSQTDSPVSNSVYIAFLAITLFGSALTMTLALPSTVQRADGSWVTLDQNPGWKDEIRAMIKTLTKDPTVLLLFPFFWASNWFYTYQFNDYNLALFNLRTRSLNALLYWLSQLFGSGLFGLLLDYSSSSARNPISSRRSRAFLGWGILTAIIFGTWGGGWVVQRTYERGTVSVKMDWSDPDYVGRAWLYISYGISDAVWQTFAYWLIGALSNDPRDLSSFVGFYKGIQSAGAAVVFRIDANKASYHAIFISSWAVLALGLLGVLPILIMRIQNRSRRNPHFEFDPKIPTNRKSGEISQINPRIPIIPNAEG
ncbi:major facilitator superfamily transporter [Melampsora larici-populina 98AG31]|uniref:Major facilitator superfamily transporter n=1 Tax=Melampsora larici-populina (strain 98AG31 / pathotype 3-4-7) TaxID=747676 RepID=F4R313_MELLP|nr:major facilitator superfamily transporter [Melampsora larici-populina 98AG31]EGG13250.1 major facilitator superfamily transporter [Melampsora larici-populina 98AG31]